jgi:hypothetical protein
MADKILVTAYAQKESPDGPDRDIPTATVNESFYNWLARWDGPGKVIVLENEAVDPAVAAVLNAIEFTDSRAHGRQVLAVAMVSRRPRRGDGHSA